MKNMNKWNQIHSHEEELQACRQALENTKMSPREHFEYLVRKGIIDRDGRVLVCRYFSGDWIEESSKSSETPPTD